MLSRKNNPFGWLPGLIVSMFCCACGPCWAQETNGEVELQPKIYLGYVGRVQADWGFLIERVEAGSLADKIGLQAGDVIFEINGTALRSPGQYYRLLGKLRGKIVFSVEQPKSGKIVQRALLVREVGNRLEWLPLEPSLASENVAHQGR